MHTELVFFFFFLNIKRLNENSKIHTTMCTKTTTTKHQKNSELYILYTSSHTTEPQEVNNKTNSCVKIYDCYSSRVNLHCHYSFCI